MISYNKIDTLENHIPLLSNDAIGSDVWSRIECAFRERIDAVELFLADVAGRFRFRSVLQSDENETAQILAERTHLAAQLPNFQKRIWLASADLVCDSDGDFWFVDDHFCCPFGLGRVASLLRQSPAPDSDSAFACFQNAVRKGIRKQVTDDNSAIVLGSGTFNTAYRENRFFAEFLGLPYVTRQRLEMRPNGMFFSDKNSPQRIQLVVRRLQDEDLDSSCYRVNSMQGVRGLVKGAQRGHVRLLNAAGTSLLNHRIIGRHIPQMIRFYLNKEPLLPTVPTAPVTARDIAGEPDIPHDVILRTDNSMDLLKPLVGPTCSDAERSRYLQKMSGSSGGFVKRAILKHVRGGQGAAQYSLRVFSAGTNRRIILRGGLRRQCYADGTPLRPVTQDETATAALIADQHVRP